MTFSIVARSDDGESWGVAVASKFLAVGAAVPAARAHVGAVATQALPNLSYKPRGLALLSEGRTAQEALDEMVGADDGKSDRQAGLVDAAGGSATYTGADCLDWAGGLTGPGVAIQGNILTGPDVVEAMHEAWQGSAGEPDLARRLLAALVAGDAAGGDRRGRQSAALLVVQEGAGYGFDDVAVDLRVDDHKAPVPELGRLLDIHALLHRPPPEADRIPWSDKLRQLAELDARTLGHASFDDWVGTENYEMRVSDSWVDKRVLRALWASSGGSR
jgi:uncharacterized Ntn-hydrolase superfamily protein